VNSNPFKLFLQFLYLGCTSFGGPVAHIAIFRRQFVSQEKRLSEDEYATLVALCQMIPGPASSQVGMGLGYRFAGWQGALAAWVGFTLPSAILMFAAALWVLSGGVANGDWFITAMKLVAVGIVTQALLGMWGQLCVDRETKIVALIAAITFYAAPTPLTQVAIIGLALFAGYLKSQSQDVEYSKLALQRVGIFGIALWLIGVIIASVPVDMNALWAVLTGHYLSGALVFGGGHVVLPLLEAEFVPPLDSEAFIAGYGFAQAMPGPLFTLSSFIGAVMLPEAAFLGAALAVIAIFLPGALLLFAVLSVGDFLMSWKQRLIFVNAAVVGLLFAVLVNPIFTEAVTSEATTGLAILSLMTCVALKRSPLELVGIMTISTYIVHLLGWL
jgi:chromate transporter